MAYTLPNQLPPGWEPIKQGFNTGENFFNHMMNRVQARHEMELRQRQHEQQLKQQQQQFMQNLGIKKQQLAHASQFDNLQKQLYQEQLKAAHNKNDPLYEFNNLIKRREAMQRYYSEQNGQPTQPPAMQGEQGQQSNPGQDNQQFPNLQNMLSGNGPMRMPEGVQQPTQPAKPTNSGMDNFKKKWDQAMQIEMATGKAPPASFWSQETPDEKRANDYQEKIKLADYKDNLTRNHVFDKGDAKIVEEMGESTIAGYDLKDTYSSLNELFQSPIFDKINESLLTEGGQRGRKLNLDKIRNYGTEDEKKWLAATESSTNKLVTQMAKVFKGPFRLGEQNLIEQMKPQAYDNPDAARSKLAEMQKALAKQLLINNKAEEYIREKKMIPSKAMKLAYDEAHGDEYKKMLEKKYGAPAGTTITSKPDEEIYELNGKKFNYIDGVWHELPKS
jgi:hypothetical protein